MGISAISEAAGERRRSNRLKLRFAVSLSRPDHQRVNAETDDLSISGFYCNSAEPFSPGERLECEIRIPEGASGSGNGIGGPSPSQPLTLHCQVQVVRVEIRGLEPGFGVACRIDGRRIAFV